MNMMGDDKKGSDSDSVLRFELNTGAKMPAVGLGTWKADPGAVGEVVIAAVKIHWPIRTKPGSGGFGADVMAPLCLPETWNAMEGLYASGQARAIGVSNFSTKKLQELLKHAKVTPAVNQVECHPIWQQPALHHFCNSTGIHLSAYSPLGSPGSWINGEVMKDETLLDVAGKLNKSPAQVALRWGIQSGHSVLPKSVNESRLKENLSVFDWCIPSHLFTDFSQIPQQRLLRGDFAINETSPYKSIQELWDGEI
ncbi:hypothetical protein Sjap_001849 [Stephania japonica]|uniref:NADP-dependent oxidoreductase domain-containing protein n=1 Tax=Stephania japonica TaxID=461633 RepID=A0AAP0KMH2_9MAGN